MTRKTDLEPYAALGRALGETIRGMSVRHEVRHLIEYAPRPRPTLVYAEIVNNEGQIWRVAPWTLGREQREAPLPHFPLAWLTGREEDAWLGQAQIRLRFEY